MFAGETRGRVRYHGVSGDDPIRLNLTDTESLVTKRPLVWFAVLQSDSDQHLSSLPRVDDLPVIVLLEPEHIDAFPRPGPPLPSIFVVPLVVHGPDALGARQVPPHLLRRNDDIPRAQHHRAPPPLELLLPQDTLGPKGAPGQGVRDADVGAGEIVQLVLVGGAGRAAGEVVRHLGEVQQEGDGVEEDEAGDTGADGGVAQHLRRDDGAEGLAHDDEALVAVVVEHGEDLGAELVAAHGRVRQPEGDGHDFQRDEADGAGGGGDEFRHQAHVGVQADANAVDEDDGQVGGGGVGVVVVGEFPGGGYVAGEERERARRQFVEKMGEGPAVEMEGVEGEVYVGDEIVSTHHELQMHERVAKKSVGMKSSLCTTSKACEGW